MITLQEFLHTPQFIMLALEKGHADYEDWFNRVFPNGAICDHDIIAALEHGINEAPAGSNSYSYDAVNKVLTVYNHLGVKSYCKDNNVALEEFNERVVIGSDFFDFSGLLKDCWSFNQPIDVPATVTTANNMFDSCYALNSPVTLHEGLEEASYMFYACRSFNQPIELPSTLVDARDMFCCAYRFNQEVHVGENVRKASHMFARCSSLSKDINVPGTIFDSYDCFDMCPFMSETGKAIKPTKTFDYDYDTDTVTVYSNRGVHDFCQMFNIAYTDFNKKVIIAEGVVDCTGMFKNLSAFNQPVEIPFSAKDCTNMFGFCLHFNSTITFGPLVKNCLMMFYECLEFNQNIDVPKTCTDVDLMFRGCKSLSEKPLLPITASQYQPFAFCDKLLNADFTEIHMPESEMLKSFVSADGQPIYPSDDITKFLYKVDDFCRDYKTNSMAERAGISDYKEWFKKTFPHGAYDALVVEEALRRDLATLSTPEQRSKQGATSYFSS